MYLKNILVVIVILLGRTLYSSTTFYRNSICSNIPKMKVAMTH